MHTPLEAAVSLLMIWEAEPRLHDDRSHAMSRSGAQTRVRFGINPGAVASGRSRSSDHWTIGFSATFRKVISTLDKKLQGRVLEALAVLAERPLEQQGDTVKPLTGELKGAWRVRIGDYRLVYIADADAHIVTLLGFESRGSSYK